MEKYPVFKSWKAVKMTMLPTAIHKFNSIPIRIPIVFCAEMTKLSLKLLQNFKGPRIDNIAFQKKKVLRKLLFLDFKSYYKATVIKPVWYWPNKRHIQVKRIYLRA